MKYLALDLETWGLFENDRQKRRPEGVAQISLVVEDTTKAIPLIALPHYTVIVAQDAIEGEPVPLAMNAWILAAIGNFTNDGRGIPTTRGPALRPEDNPYPIRWLKGAWRGATQFLDEHFPVGKITVAGKNIMSFDVEFCPDNIRSRFRHRSLDPTMFATDFLRDEVPPNAVMTKNRLGVLGTTRHDAYNDNIDTIACLRTKYGHFTTDDPVVESKVAPV